MSTLEDSGFPITAILGVGSMGGAILEGLLAPNVQLQAPVKVTANSKASAAQFIEVDNVIAYSLEANDEANRKAVRGAEVVILGVKPNMIVNLVKEIAEDLKPGAVVVSVAAGIELESMREFLPDGVALVRAMPNTPSLVRKGVTGITAEPGTPGASVDLVRRVFNTVGEVILLETEAQLNSLSAVSGSGPAYVFLFIQKMTEAAMRLGFTHEQSKLMVEGTFLGSTLLLQDQGVDPQELRLAVTSPNGTTEQAIKKFEAAGLETIFDDALMAAINRAEEIASQN